MQNNRNSPPSRWLYSIAMIPAFVLAGFFIGVMYSEGFSTMRLLPAILLSVVGLLLFWQILDD